MKASPRSELLALACIASWTVAPTLAVAQAAAPSAPAQQPGASPPVDSPAAQPGAPSAEGGETAFDLTAELREGASELSAAAAAARAIAVSVDVARAQATTEQARQAAAQALVAVYPRLDLEANYTRLSLHDPPEIAQVSDGMSTVRISGIQQITDIYSLQARLTVPLSDLFLQYLPRYEAADRLASVQQLRELAERRTVALRAQEAYYEYARARAAKLIAEAALAQTEAQRRDVQALVRGGALARVEEMRAQAQVAAARVALARAEGNVAVAQTALRVLLQEEGEAEFSIAEDLVQPLPELTQTKQELLASALASRSELKALRAMRGVHERTLDAEHAAKLPKLALSGLAELTNPNQRVAPFTREFNGSWQVGAALSWSPNDFFVADKRASRAQADREVSEADLRLFELALRGEVAQAYEDFIAAREAQAQAQAGITAAEEAYRVRREQFRAGSVVATEVVQAETELRRARLELVSAAIDARIARARIARAVEELPR